jgi:hypothetical protein
MYSVANLTDLSFHQQVAVVLAPVFSPLGINSAKLLPKEHQELHNPR